MNHIKGFSTLIIIIVISALLSFFLVGSTFLVSVLDVQLHTARRNFEQKYFEDSCKRLHDLMLIENPRAPQHVIIVDGRECPS